MSGHGGTQDHGQRRASGDGIRTPASRTTTGSSRHPSMRRYAGAVVYEGLHSPDAVAVRSRECVPQAAHLASRPRKPYTMHRTAPRRSGVLAARRTGEWE